MEDNRHPAPRARARVLDAHAVELVLAHLRDIPNVSRAARLVGCTPSALYTLRDTDPEFARDMRDALEEGVGRMEEEAHRRAFVGTPGRPVMHEGVVVREVTEYSDALTSLLLRAHAPERYRDNVSINGSVALDATTAAAKIEALLRLAQQRKDGADLL